MGLTFHDMFCGAGGSTLGAFMAGATPVIGLNHWPIACESYDANHAHAGAVSACVDVVTQDPRRYPPADMLLASPECTHHSYARGKKKDDPSLFDPHGDMAAERSRATMWDVIRFAEVHDYKAVIVENVEAAVKWGLPKGRKLKHGDYGPLFVAWLQAMEALDYRWRVVHLNSMVCGVPQSRDRLYIVFWKKTQRTPDLDIPALAWCPKCDVLVNAVQTWKRPGATTGTHGAGYYYGCPACASMCALAIRPAAAAIDWALTAERIGDRRTPLKPATIERVRRGLEVLRKRPRTVRLRDGLVVQVGGNTFERPGYTRAWPLEDPMPAVTGTSDRALVLPTTHHGDGQRSRRADSEPVPTVTGANRGELALVLSIRGDGDDRRPAMRSDVDPLRTVAATCSTQAMVVPAGSNPANARSVDQPMHTLTGSDRLGVVVTCRGDAGGADRRATDPECDPLAAITASGNHHGLIQPDAAVVALRGKVDRPGGVNDPTLPESDPLGTVSAQGNHHGLVIANYGSPGGPKGKQGWARHVDDGPVGTVTATDSHGLFCYRDGQDMRWPGEPLPTVATIEQHAIVGPVTEDEIAGCTFRMLQPHELKIASGFTADYMLKGTKRDQVCQVGNAVTAPAEAELVRRVMESIS